MSEISAIPRKCTQESFEFKSLMTIALERYLDENPDRSKKSVASALDATSADLSHWLSLQCEFTIPGHKVSTFCRIVGDNSLIWHIQQQYEAAS